MFYFLNYAYNPNTAAANRTLAYLKGLSELGIKTRVEFFLTNISKSKISQNYPNIDINYRWDKWYYINHRFAKHIYYVFSVISFIMHLKKVTLFICTIWQMYSIGCLKRQVLTYILKKRNIPAYIL